jgi:preprotein translocase subunit Sss1
MERPPVHVILAGLYIIGLIAMAVYLLFNSR